MDSIQQIRASLRPEIESLNERIAACLQSPNELLNTVVGHYLEVKGKQLRPVLVILAAKLFGAVNDKTIACGAAVEILHNSSLIHDDVVDDSDTRRGRPTVNNRWDNRIAVLVGDYFIAKSLTAAIDTGIPAIIDIIGRLGELLTLGELDQICTARHHDLSVSNYFDIIDNKTASLFEACVEAGAYSVGATPEEAAPLMRFAHLLGECFQIRDDVFDYFPSDDGLGKPTSNDLREGKVTLPLLYALTVAPPDASTDAMRALEDRDVLGDEDIHALVTYARERGGIEYAFDTMRKLSLEARSQLNAYGNNPVAAEFLQLLDFTITRDK